jgi:hypothetical protein
MKWYLLSVWLAGVALESLLLVRAFTSKWFRIYPIFFVYLFSVFAQELILLTIYIFKLENYYTSVYWYEEFFSLVLGCGVTWEIFRLILGRYPGAGRMARNVLLFALVMTISKSAANAWSHDIRWPTTGVELESNLRAIQALSLIVLALLAAYYEVPIGRNSKGIFMGYGLFIATSVVTLTLRASLGRKFQTSWVYLQPLCYFVVLGIWCRALWEYEPAPPPELRPKIEEDYRSIALGTRKGLLQARAFLGKAMRP